MFGFILVASKVLTRVERKHYVCVRIHVLGQFFLSLFTRVLGQFYGAGTPTTLLHLVGFWAP